jgi:diaminopimelate decarboxylase
MWTLFSSWLCLTRPHSSSALSLALVERFPEVEVLNLGPLCSPPFLPFDSHLSLGGGFKVARVDGEKSTDLQSVGEPVKEVPPSPLPCADHWTEQMIQSFSEQHGRPLHFEIEPGTFLVANAGVLLTTVQVPALLLAASDSLQDIVSTGPQGFNFLKIDSGMTEVSSFPPALITLPPSPPPPLQILRPSLYGASHPIEIFATRAREPREGEEATAETSAVRSYVVV